MQRLSDIEICLWDLKKWLQLLDLTLIRGKFKIKFFNNHNGIKIFIWFLFYLDNLD